MLSYLEVLLLGIYFGAGVVIGIIAIADDKTSYYNAHGKWELKLSDLGLLAVSILAGIFMFLVFVKDKTLYTYKKR